MGHTTTQAHTTTSAAEYEAFRARLFAWLAGQPDVTDVHTDPTDVSVAYFSHTSGPMCTHLYTTDGSPVRYREREDQPMGAGPLPSTDTEFDFDTPEGVTEWFHEWVRTFLLEHPAVSDVEDVVDGVFAFKVAGIGVTTIIVNP